MRHATTVVLALIMIANTGCYSTCNNMMNDRAIYGGTVTDAGALLSIPATAAVCCGLKSDGDYEMLTPEAVLCLCLYLGVVDLPFSVVGDTLTLPLTIRATLGRLREVRAPKDAAPEQPTPPLARSDPHPASAE